MKPTVKPFDFFSVSFKICRNIVQDSLSSERDFIVCSFNFQLRLKFYHQHWRTKMCMNHFRTNLKLLLQQNRDLKWNGKQFLLTGFIPPTLSNTRSRSLFCESNQSLSTIIVILRKVDENLVQISLNCFVKTLSRTFALHNGFTNMIEKQIKWNQEQVNF